MMYQFYGVKMSQELKSDYADKEAASKTSKYRGGGTKLLFFEVYIIWIDSILDLDVIRGQRNVFLYFWDDF